MKLKQYINEEYYKRVKVNGRSIEVFINPSKKERKEAADKHNSIRFIADNKTKKVYVWNVYRAVHMEMYKALSLGNDFQNDTFKRKIIPGIADVLNSGKSIMYSSDWLGDFFFRTEYGLTIKDLEKVHKDFQWVNTYIDINAYFKELKVDLKDRADLKL